MLTAAQEKVLQRVRFRLASDIESCEAAIAKFTASVAENPAYAFKWSDGAFQAAAKMNVAKLTLQTIDHEKGGLTIAVQEARRHALRGARNPERSTSQTANLIALYETEAWAEYLEALEDKLEDFNG